jgi:hypothetical protein
MNEQVQDFNRQQRKYDRWRIKPAAPSQIGAGRAIGIEANANVAKTNNDRGGRDEGSKSADAGRC